MRILVDEAAWTAKGIVFKKTGNRYRFMLDGRDDVVQAAIVNGALDLYPERSTAAKALISALGK